MLHKPKGKIKFKLRLFLAFTLLFTCIALAISILFFQNLYSNTKKNEVVTSHVIIDRVSTQIASLYEQMDIATTSMTKNHTLRKAILELNATLSNNSLDTLPKNLPNEKLISSTLTNLMFSSNISNALLYDKYKNYFYYVGLYLGKDAPIKYALQKDDIATVFTNQKTTKIYLGPHQSPWSKNTNIVLSTLRNFSDHSTTKNTIIEIQVPYKHLEAICTQTSFEQEKEIIILDVNNNIIYPYHKRSTVLSEAELSNVLSSIKEGTPEKYSYHYSYYSESILENHFKVVLLSKNISLQQSIKTHVEYAILAFFVLLLPTLGIVFAIISIISKPLQNLITYINNISLEKSTKLQLPSNTLDEFEIINESFNQLLENLKESVRQTYEAQIRESNASLAALQAQINPHFLYNAMNCISAAGEVYGSEVTTKMCQHFSLMMRYITTNSTSVTLEEELNHTRNYLEFMRISYDGSLTYTIDSSMDTSSINLPQLIIQPLVENCFNHAFKNTVPPWNILINCYTLENCWYVEISDNGDGFSEEIITEIHKLKEKLKQEDNKLLYQELNIDGLGLKNIIGRLSIYFHHHFDFLIDNKASGCTVTIKGVLNND